MPSDRVLGRRSRRNPANLSRYCGTRFEVRPWVALPTAPSMTHWQRVEEIFHLALEQPTAGRDVFVREQCGSDGQLEHDVRRVLDGYEADERGRASQSAPGTRYGAFEIVRKIGEGGMGAVYLGRRSEDFEQRAAIKLMSGGPF